MSRKDADFFQSIRRSVKLSYIISSLLPLLILLYVLHKFVFPRVGYEVAEDVQIYLMGVVVISVLGLFFLSKETNKSISSAENLQTKLNSLIGITKQFRETLYLDILLESIVKSAMHLNSAESGSLLLYDEAGDLRFKVLVGDRGQKIKDHIVKRGEGITGWVAEKGEAAIINDTSADKRFNSQFDKESGYTTRSIMCVPLIHSNEVIGVIEVLNKKAGVFTEEDQRLLYTLADQASISIAQSRSFESRHSDLIHITELLVSAQDFHTPEKKGHARRVASYANMIAKEMGLSENEMKTLYYAALFHDIGLLKVSVHERTQKEKIRQHPQLGYDMISPISIWKAASELILNHHERYDGSGYPAGRSGDDIPVGAKILSVASTFDVLTSTYSYKEKIDYGRAMTEIESHSGKQFDPDVVRAFKTAVKNSDMISE